METYLPSYIYEGINIIKKEDGEKLTEEEKKINKNFRNNVHKWKSRFKNDYCNDFILESCKKCEKMRLVYIKNGKKLLIPKARIFNERKKSELWNLLRDAHNQLLHIGFNRTKF